MDALARIESSLADAVLSAEASGSPPRLAAAMRHAVFPKGARIRPRLTLAVAAACGDDQPRLASLALTMRICGAAGPPCIAPLVSLWPYWPVTG
jgi:geranylgeranyl diphosphate synthase type II